jgi:multidrug efflux pump
MSAYMPIVFMSGLTGKLFTEFAITLAGTIFISGVVSLQLFIILFQLILNHS